MRDYENYRRMAAFLSQYISLPGDRLVPADPMSITGAIFALIQEEMFTKEELKLEALDEYGVIIPDWLFMDPKEVEEMLNGKSQLY